MMYSAYKSREMLPTNDWAQKGDFSGTHHPPGQIFLVTALKSETPSAHATYFSQNVCLHFLLLLSPSSCTGLPPYKSLTHLIPYGHLLRSRHKLTHDANDKNSSDGNRYTRARHCLHKHSFLAIIIIMADFLEYVPGPCISCTVFTKPKVSNELPFSWFCKLIGHTSDTCVLPNF